MSTQLYLILHLIGIIALFYALGGLALHAYKGGNRNFGAHRFIMTVHGLAMMLVLIPGFGLLAKTGVAWPWPLWVWGKLVAWLILGGIPRLILTKTEWAKGTYWVALLVGAWAILMVELKP